MKAINADELGNVIESLNNARMYLTDYANLVSAEVTLKIDDDTTLHASLVDGLWVVSW